MCNFVCNNINTLIDRIIEKRSLNEENILIRIGLDGGGGFVKMCLSVFNMEEKKGEVWRTKRLGERFVDSGIKKAMLIGIVPNVQENYMNIKTVQLTPVAGVM